MDVNKEVPATQTPRPMDTPAIFLMGATACGKTALSLSLAKCLGAEIISVDSALVYKGLDIGTAKPTIAEREGVTHHLIDVIDPWQSYSAARFCSDANSLIDTIHARGKRVMLVGGTMLYFKALEEGLAELPEADEQIRKALANEANASGWQAMHAQLNHIDPVAAARIHPNDPQRVQRALEVYRISGVPMSELQSRTHSQLKTVPLKFALVPSERAWLHQRIEQRFESMLLNGFMDEVKNLRHDARMVAGLPAIRSVGYRQAWEFLDRQQNAPVAVQGNDVDWIQQAMAATRQLAKRQLTWLRSMENVVQITCDTLSIEQQFDTIKRHITDNENL